MHGLASVNISSNHWECVRKLAGTLTVGSTSRTSGGLKDRMDRFTIILGNLNAVLNEIYYHVKPRHECRCLWGDWCRLVTIWAT